MCCFFSQIATINEFALGNRKNILHVARLNHNSEPLFRRLLKAGIYRFCDLKGNPCCNPVNTSNGVLYAGTYPIEGINRDLSKFVFEDVAIELSNMLKRQKQSAWKVKIW